MEEKFKGKRFNEGKLRFDLLPPYALQEVSKVLTFGSEKYGDDNWKKGMKWSNMMASLERHYQAFKRCEDFDSESNILHVAHLACNSLMLLEYYKIFPQGDDRFNINYQQRRIGLDIDEVIADWVKHWCNYHNLDTPNFWNFDKDIKEKFELLKDNKEFWLSIPVKTKPEDLPFEPTCYITSRNIPKEWTEEWLQINNFPSVPVYSIGFNQSKVDIAKELNLDIFVDDRYENFIELNKNGVCCFLFDAPHNQRYDVGFKRIKSLKDL